MRRWTLMLFLLSIPFIISGAVNADNEEKTHSEKTYRAIPDQDGVQRVSIIGGSYFFTPSHIIVKVNMPVELKVKKEPGIVPHNIVSKSAEAGIKFDEALDSEPKLIKFTPTKVGIFPFYCDKKLLFFESHQEKGMTGKIEVVP